MPTRVVSSSAAANGTTSVVLPLQSNVLAGDLLTIRVISKPETNTPTNPAGWTLLGTGTGGTGSAGAGVGPLRVTVWTRLATATDDAPAVTVSLTGANVMLGAQHAYRVDTPGNVMTASWLGVGSDTTSGTAYAATAPTGAVFIVGDVLASDSAFSAAVTASAPSHPIPGATLSDNTAVHATNTTTGNAATIRAYSERVATGPSNGTATSASWTLSAASYGATAFHRITEAAAGPSSALILTTSVVNPAVIRAATR